MPLTYHPKLGEIVLCDYNTGFIDPEMNKRRPVVIISPRLRQRDNLMTVIPLSTTEPKFIEEYHYVFEIETKLPKPFDSHTMWAKCDMISTVSRARLDRFRNQAVGRQHRAKYITGQLSLDHITGIRRAMLHALGLTPLTQHL